MKKTYSYLILLFSFLIISTSINCQVSLKKALILIDIQEFYFPGGFSELHNPEGAAKKASQVLKYFRDTEQLVVHVQHQTKEQMAIHNSVAPLESEKVIIKTEINCFNGTDLYDYLKKKEIEEVIIVGMQTHMCVEGATRAAYDLGFKVKLLSDACTTKNLKWRDKEIGWEMVQLSTLKTLTNYAEIMETSDYLKNMEK